MSRDLTEIREIVEPESDQRSTASLTPGRWPARLTPLRDPRYQRAALTTIAGVGARGAVILVSLVSVPLLLGYVGAERYAIWAAASAIGSILVFTDFGIGNGLVTAVAQAAGVGNQDRVRAFVTSGLFALTALAVALVPILAIVAAVVPWAQLFNVSQPTAVSEAGTVVLIFLLSFVVSLPLSVAGRVQTGHQEGYLPAFWTAAGAIASLVAVIVLINVRAPLPVVVLALTGLPVCALAGNFIVEFTRRRRWLLQGIDDFDASAARYLLRLGFMFFVLQLVIAVAYQSDVLVAARIVGPTAATDYSIVYRLFMVVPAIINLGLTPLWPAYADAISRGDIAWVRRTVSRSVGIAIGVSVVAIAGALVASRWLLDVWVGPSVQPPTALLIGMALWAMLTSAFNGLAMLFNGAAVLRFQVIVGSMMAVGSIAASIVLASRIGVAGVIWGTVIAYVVLSAVPQLLYLPRLIARLEARTAA
jgi:O-antigen/teichoic acid export membrane protein